MRQRVRWFRVNEPEPPYYDEYMLGRYDTTDTWYHRHMRTWNEIERNRWAELDGHRIRRKRNTIPITWDDLGFSQAYGRDWKRFTKRKHQYYPAVL